MLIWYPSRSYLVKRIKVAADVTTLQGENLLDLSSSTHPIYFVLENKFRRPSFLRRKSFLNSSSQSGLISTLNYSLHPEVQYHDFLDEDLAHNSV